MKKKWIVVVTIVLALFLVAGTVFAAVDGKIWEEDMNTRTVLFSRLDVAQVFWTIDGYDVFVRLPSQAVKHWYKNIDCGYNSVEVVRVYAKSDGTVSVEGACQPIIPAK